MKTPEPLVQDPANASAPNLSKKGVLSHPLVRLALLGVIVCAGLALVYQTPLGSYLKEAQRLRGDITKLGWLGPFVFTLAVAVMVALGLPRLLLAVVAGMTFGLWTGVLWSQLGALLGSWAAFIACRKGLLGLGEKFHSRWPQLDDWVADHGILAVILSRQIPLPALALNAALALTELRQREFLIGTVLGQLPQTIACAMIGAGLLSADFKHSMRLIAAAIALMAAAWLAVQVLRRKTGKS